ncbi:hypothetical protein Bca101_063241 [Brassica carinata]
MLPPIWIYGYIYIKFMVVLNANAKAKIYEILSQVARDNRSAQFVVGRLIRFWDSRNINKNGEFFSPSMSW